MIKKYFLAGALSLCGLVSSAFAEGPQRFSLNIHNSGFNDTYFNALSDYEEDVDMIRIGNKRKFDGDDPRNSLPQHIINTDDPLLEELAQKYGWNRILLGIGDKNDERTPTIAETVNAFETGFAQRMVQAFPHIEYVQLFNEHCNFDKICGGQYVLYLKPFYEWVHDVENPRRFSENISRRNEVGFTPSPMVKVVSSASFGMKLGLSEALLDIAAGMLEYCDIIGVHDYDGANALFYAHIRNELGKNHIPIWVTETGSPFWDKHNLWLTKEVKQMEEDISENYTGTLPQHIFWYAAHVGSPPEHGGTAGYNQFGLFIFEDGKFVPTNNEMHNLIMNRFVSEEPIPVNAYVRQGTRRVGGRSP